MLTLVFPGQGAQQPTMVDSLKGLATFRRRYQFLCEHVGTDVLREVESGDHALINTNLYSSLMTVLVGTVSLDLFRDRSEARPDFLAGYSVGQWTAIYAAGMITYEQLIRIVTQRARSMDKCMHRQGGAMSAVIGISQEKLEALLQELRADGHQMFIGNYNCVGQYSIAGTCEAIEVVEHRLRALNPKKLIRLPVEGAWHCPLLKDAEREFSVFLDDVTFQPRNARIVDNVTSEWLPDDVGELRGNLARHLTHPVRWESSIKMLIAQGCSRLVEIGYGSMLAKFGGFIDRRVSFSSFYN